MSDISNLSRQIIVIGLSPASIRMREQTQLVVFPTDGRMV